MSIQLDFIYDSEIFVDLYGIMEIEMDVKHDEIKLAYIKMAKKNHPDQGGSSEKFQEITRAYEILYNKELRKEYDLYYLKKSMDEFRGDEYTRLRDEFKNFVNSNTKPISKEELDKLYADTFNEYREQYKESQITREDLQDKINDIKIERKNMQIETSNDALANFISKHKDVVNINEVFDFINYKNTQSFSNQIINKEWGTLDSMPGYYSDYSSFIDDNEFTGSKLYSNISDMNPLSSSELTNDLDIQDFIQWKSNKRCETKLTDNNIDDFLKKRMEEQIYIEKQIEKQIETNFNSNSKNENENENSIQDKKITKPKILKSKLPEIIDLDNNLDENGNGTKSDTMSGSDINPNANPNPNPNANSSDINGILKFMESVNSANTYDFEELEKEIGIDKLDKKDKLDKLEHDTYSELKSNANLPKSNNVRKRDIV